MVMQPFWGRKTVGSTPAALIRNRPPCSLIGKILLSESKATGSTPVRDGAGVNVVDALL